MNMYQENMIEAPLVCLKALTKTYGQFNAVKQLDLSIRKGEFLTFLGASGSGKSTTLAMIAGFETPSSGEILLNEKSIVKLPSHKRGIGMVFQNYSLFPHMTVRQNIEFPLTIRRQPESEKTKKVEQILQLVQLEAFADRRPAMLSGGQKQRVAIARALVYEPEILLMDEPLGALDKKLREDLQDELRQLHKRLGITIIYVTHDQEEAMRMSERIAIFKRGEIVGIGSGKDLYQQPPNAFVASFLGNSNFLEIELSGGESARFESEPLTVKQENSERAHNGKALLMIRPEHIQVMTTAEAMQSPLPDGFNQLSAQVEELVFLGESLTCNLVTATGCQITSKCIAHDFPAISEGTHAVIRWDSTRSSIYYDWEAADIVKNSVN